MSSYVKLSLSGSITCGEGDALVCSVSKNNNLLGVCRIVDDGPFRQDVPCQAAILLSSDTFSLTVMSEGSGIIRVGSLGLIASLDNDEVLVCEVSEASPIAILNYDGVIRKEFKLRMAAGTSPAA